MGIYIDRDAETLDENYRDLFIHIDISHLAENDIF